MHLSTAEIIVSAAAAEEKDNPDPFISSAAVMFAAAIATATAVSKSVAAAAAQNQDQPDGVAAVSSIVATAITSTVCCSQIAHSVIPPELFYTSSYVGWHVTVSAILEKPYFYSP